MILLTGFEPFDNYTRNPSQEIAEALDGCEIAEQTVKSLILPVEFGQDTGLVFPAIRDLKPAVVLSLGLAAGKASIDVERFAVNLRIRERSAPWQTVILPGAPAAYFATIDTDAVAKVIRVNAGVPAREHSYAGSNLCNHILYQTLHFAAINGLDYKAGFLHLPMSSEQAVAEDRLNTPNLPIASLTDSVRVAIEACVLSMPHET